MVDIQGRLSSLALPLKMAVMIWSRAKQTSPRMMTREGPLLGPAQDNVPTWPLSLPTLKRQGRGPNHGKAAPDTHMEEKHVGGAK